MENKAISTRFLPFVVLEVAVCCLGHVENKTDWSLFDWFSGKSWMLRIYVKVVTTDPQQIEVMKYVLYVSVTNNIMYVCMYV